jgi:hypothetical protein
MKGPIILNPNGTAYKAEEATADHLDSHDLNYLAGATEAQLQEVADLDAQAEKMVTEDLHDVPMTLEQIQAAEGIMRSWLLQMREHPTAKYDLATLGMLQVIQRTQNVFADYLNAYYAAMQRAEEAQKDTPEEES